MRLLVFGGRDLIAADVAAWLEHHALARLGIERAALSLLIEGGATGADRGARFWAQSIGLPVKTYEADWDNITRPGAVVRYTRTGKPYNAAAGGMRNQLMLDDGKPDAVIGFPGGRGTADMWRRINNLVYTADVLPKLIQVHNL